MQLIAEGLTDREIAAVLWISYHTVRRHSKNLYVLLGVRNRAACVAKALEAGLMKRDRTRNEQNWPK